MHTHTHIHTHMHTCTQTHTHTHTCIHTQTYIHTHMHTRTHIHTHTHTHTHTSSSHYNLCIKTAIQRLMQMNIFHTQVLFTNIFHRNNVSALCIRPAKGEHHHPDGKHGNFFRSLLSWFFNL